MKSLPNYKYYLKHLRKKESIKYSFCQVSIYDVVDNACFNKLIRTIYRLKHNKRLEVKTYYLYHRFRKVDYINSNLTGRQIGSIATITPKKDKWIRSIELAYTYINNSEAIIQYTFSFNKVINTPLKIHQFIEDMIMYVKKEPYFFAYNDMTYINKVDYQELLRLDDILFADILQAFICTLFYTKLGKQFKLPIEYSYLIENYNKKIRNRLRNTFLCNEYEKGSEHIVISALENRYEFYYFIKGKYFPRPKMLDFFSTFPTEMYFTAFSRIEVAELERRMRKYLNSNKNFVSSRDLKWLVNKKRHINDQEQRMERTLSNENRKYISEMIDWCLYIRGKLQNGDFINYPEQTNYFLKMFEENLSYLNAIASVQNNKIIIIIAAATFLATIISIFVGILF